jgi:hypothetical protein
MLTPLQGYCMAIEHVGRCPTLMLLPLWGVVKHYYGDLLELQSSASSITFVILTKFFRFVSLRWLLYRVSPLFAAFLLIANRMACRLF